MAVKVPFTRRVVKTFASVRTGIILLIVIGVVAAVGTVVLQSPITSPEEMQRAYSPQTLQWLKMLGLTDVFHTWWWSLLLALFAVSIILASLERFPNAWRFFARPYRRPDPHFRAVLPARKQIRVPDGNAEHAIQAAERALHNCGLKPERVVENDEASLYAERHRFSVLGAYVVHVALLLILAGFIVDGLVGYRGFMVLTEGQQSNRLEGQSGSQVLRTLPFTIRCDAAGQENYPDGTPKKYWSKLVVLENSREVARKEIIVNDPLVYRGVRFYQASFGQTPDYASLVFAVAKSGDEANSTRKVEVPRGGALELDPNQHLRVLRFLPDYYKQDNGEVYQRSNDLVNPALLLQLTKADGKNSEFWIFPAEQRVAAAGDSGYYIGLLDIHLINFTGLSVSHEPGQWAIWGGVVMIAIGLIMAFYFTHVRFWALPVTDESGALALWVGASAGRHRETLEDLFRHVTDEIENELKPKVRAAGAGH